MSFNTRFNPSANGGLHLGHVYPVLINEAVAHESGGHFTVRFEDTARSSLHLMPFVLQERIAELQQDEIMWLGVPVDEWSFQSDIDEEVTILLRERFHYEPLPDEPWRFAEIAGGAFQPYPFTPTLTARKVVMDWMQGVNFLIRGIDLATEYSLYQFYCVTFALPLPRHFILPRLRDAHGDVSKSNGSTTVAELRAAGLTPEEVRWRVSLACLRNASLPWALHNLNPEPRL
jgi:glutamyl/glutaminyl-tRNA synthetase